MRSKLCRALILQRPESQEGVEIIVPNLSPKNFERILNLPPVYPLDNLQLKSLQVERTLKTNFAENENSLK